ncbi:hypothetical protein [Desulfosarcina ovata]|uniref:hypothetical protein n=1 Tax=Desulfosarcina ovata TaxID=83564 RepID=UPI0012D2DC18|nr:hypothetical protein [Desulfosarcina ovata]
MEIKKVYQIDQLLTIISIVVTTISIVISMPPFGIDLNNVSKTVMICGLPLRVVYLFLIDGTLAYRFGFLFFLIGNRFSTTIENPAAFLLNILTAIVSSWVTFFNIELFISNQSSLRFLALIFWGTVFIILGIALLYFHLKRCEPYNKFYSSAILIT